MKRIMECQKSQLLRCFRKLELPGELGLGFNVCIQMEADIVSNQKPFINFDIVWTALLFTRIVDPHPSY